MTTSTLLRMNEHGLTQVAMIMKLKERGINTTPTQFSWAVRGIQTTPKAKRMLNECNRILSEIELADDGSTSE